MHMHAYACICMYMYIFIPEKIVVTYFYFILKNSCKSEFFPRYINVLLETLNNEQYVKKHHVSVLTFPITRGGMTATCFLEWLK